MRRLVLLAAAITGLLVGATPARAQTWVDNLLPERSHDFGNVARGSKVRHSFRLVNRLDQEVRIADWRTKCGCTEVRVGARVIPPGTQTTIEAVIDTTKFLGYKKSGLTLVLNQPAFAEVDLDLSCFIRGDIVLNPGGVDFGIVTRAAGAKPAVTLSLAYAGGMPGWGVTKMQTRSPALSVKLQEQARSADGQVQYLLTATLDPKDVNGFFKDEITLVTNDPNGPAIPVSVTATVQASLTVSPSPLLLGSVKAGQSVTKALLVRASQPFTVSGVKSSRDEVSASPNPAAARPVHTVNLTFKAPSQPGPFHAEVQIESDLKDEPPAKVTVFATVVP